MIIGLTGGIGSGKTTVANMFVKLGIDIVDADIVARQVVEVGTPGLTAIAEHFGQDILLEDNTLNRAKLREIVFSDKQRQTWLNNLMQPLIRAKLLKDVAACKSPYCIIVAPLLLENGLEKIVNRVLVVDVDEQSQIKRATARDNCDIQVIKNIIAAQIARDKRLALADDVIDNSEADLSLVEQQVELLHHKYLALAQTNN
ncbi:dephospho-CoA kinase [Colwellia sp. MEBiC06753]